MQKRELAIQYGIPVKVEEGDGEVEGEGEDKKTSGEEITIGSGQWEGEVQATPTTSLLLQFDQVLTARVLTFHVGWLADTNLEPIHSQWLFSLLARIQKPLNEDTVCVVRQLYRRCCFLRSELSPQVRNTR
jgi:survival of motor neuron protein-interacting protein 1